MPSYDRIGRYVVRSVANLALLSYPYYELLQKKKKKKKVIKCNDIRPFGVLGGFIVFYAFLQ